MVVERRARVDVAVAELDHVRARSGETSSSAAITDSPRSPASWSSRSRPRSYLSSLIGDPCSCVVRARSWHAEAWRGRGVPPPKSEAEGLLEIEADAWFEYLDGIRNLSGHEPRYAEVEPWAWARLAVRLRTVETGDRS